MMAACASPTSPGTRSPRDRALAAAHPDGIVDLSVGTPVDPVPDVVRAALAGPAADEPGYPTTHGPAVAARRRRRRRCARRFGVTVDPAAVLPTIGSKELVAWLPTLLGLGAGDTVVIPELAYPTYEVGALLAGADVRAHRTRLAALGPGRVGAGLAELAVQPDRPGAAGRAPAQGRDWARERGAVVASDECYLSLSGTPTGAALGPAPGRLRRRPHAACSPCTRCPSRRTWPATGPAFVAGDPALVAALLEVRKHAGMIVPRPVQAAMAAAASDDAHVAAQAALYDAPARPAAGGAGGVRAARSSTPRPGCTCGPPRASRAGRPCDRLAERGILVAPGEFYGPAGAQARAGRA